MIIPRDIQHCLAGVSNSTENICLPISYRKHTKEFTISNNMNRATHYCIVDFKKAESSILNLSDINSILQNSNGMGFKALDISVIICGGVSAVVQKILKETGISVLKSHGDSIIRNLDLFMKKQLSEFSKYDATPLMTCPTSCNSCGSGCS